MAVKDKELMRKQSVSAPKKLIALGVARAKRLNMNFSQYVTHLISNDLKTRGDFTIREDPEKYGKKEGEE